MIDISFCDTVCYDRSLYDPVRLMTHDVSFDEDQLNYFLRSSCFIVVGLAPLSLRSCLVLKKICKIF